ncbi:MAG: TetR/AcrR family transcriptional regulator, partial [Campylobacterota bacterium]
TTKEKIITASIKLFSELGYKGTTVRKIAAQVGIKQGALYNHFKNKEDIFHQIIQDIGSSALSDLYEKYDEESLIEKNKLFLSEFVTVFKLISFDSKNEKIFKIMMIELFQNESVRNSFNEHFYQQNLKKLSQVFFIFMQNGLIKSSDPLLLANEFIAPLFFYQMQVILQKTDAKSTVVTATMFEKHVDFFWDSIKTN